MLAVLLALPIGWLAWRQILDGSNACVFACIADRLASLEALGANGPVVKFIKGGSNNLKVGG